MADSAAARYTCLIQDRSAHAVDADTLHALLAATVPPGSPRTFQWADVKLSTFKVITRKMD